MQEIDYSVIIRTLGKANEKYLLLLQSISRLIPQPKEVIVVLPEGYDLPEQRLGCEKFYFSPKGMVAQRTYGLKMCKTEYALFCDDDVNFPEDFVSKLFIPVQKGLGKVSIAPLYSFLPYGKKGKIIDALTSAAVPTVFNKKNYCTVLKGTGYSYNNHLKKEKAYYYTQSAAGTCFFSEIGSLKKCQFDKEKWIDLNGYAAMEDQTLFYKLYLMGIKTIVVTDAFYVHADAKTSTKNNNLTPKYCLGFNRRLFWQRFIYERQKNPFMKLWARICFSYHKSGKLLFEWLSYKVKKGDINCYLYMKKGYSDAKKYIVSDDYRLLPEF